jgi:pimeloyl-ACP methyl ester carboxylesterase
MQLLYQAHTIRRGGHRIHARDYSGGAPAIILMHGFPDNLHLYDALVPLLVKAGRRVITFDFLGWGSSDKPDDHTYDHHSLTQDLDAVIRHFALEGVVLVAHDASGPPAIDWALDHPSAIAGLVLLNTYYHATPTLRAPEAIFAFSRPFGVGKLFQKVSQYRDWFRRLYWYQVGHFIRSRASREAFVPLLYQQMDGPLASSTKKAFFGLNDDLVWTNIQRLSRVPQMRQFQRPVRIIFGAGDQYLNVGVARDFHRLFPNSELFLLEEGWHFVQIDEPERVAQHILEMPLMETHWAGEALSPQHQSHPVRLRLMYLMFGLMNILFAPVILADRWRIFRRVQTVFNG